MKKHRERSTNKRTYSLIVHKDGSSTRIVLYGTHSVRLCFFTLEYYYARIRPLATGIALYRMREHATLQALYMYANKPWGFRL